MQEPANRFGLRGLRKPVTDPGDNLLSDADGVSWQALPAPPQPRDSLTADEDERAFRAEQMALVHHRTSLLGGVDWRSLSGSRREDTGRAVGVFLIQIIVVVVIAGSLAFVIDPAVIPPEWFESGRQLISDLTGS